MEKYDYYQVTEPIKAGDKKIAESWYKWFKGLGHRTWIDRTRDQNGTYWFTVWRYGQGVRRGDNQDECIGVIVKASHPEIRERFKGNNLSKVA